MRGVNMTIEIVKIEATDIPDAWFQAVSNIIDHGFKYEIQQGSFVGQTRLEYDFAVIHIKHPYAEPYDLMLPQIPVHLNIPNPVANGYVEEYMPYLMTGEKLSTEDYTYGQRINNFRFTIERHKHEDGIHIVPDQIIHINQVKHFINLLKETPNTNQAILQVGAPPDCLLVDPPCLRHIDMRIKTEYLPTEYDTQASGVGNVKRQLIFYPYFRSWDLWGGFPANLAGIAVLQKYMADEIGVEAGPIIASSKGLHLYGYVEELAKLRCNKMEC
jgi:thymidylate synthase